VHSADLLRECRELLASHGYDVTVIEQPGRDVCHVHARVVA
jgi:hypothetical protein